MQKKTTILIIIFFVFLVCNFTLWLSVRDQQAQWLNVPPPPNPENSAAAGLGDKGFAYRSVGFMLQNLGDSGGRSTPLSDYDYERLGQWFLVADALDEKSNFIPFLAAHYFGAVQNPAKLPPVIEYLSNVGERTEGEKWRWLVQAIHLARYRLNDIDRALDIARKLASLDVPDLPIWAKNMDALIMNVKGEKQAAYEIMIQTLQSEGDKLDPTETLFIVDLICSELLDADAAKDHPLCQTLPF